MKILAELLFKIGARSSEKNAYPVTPHLSINGQEQIFPDDFLSLDTEELFRLRGEHDKYNARLSNLFFQGKNASNALLKAQSQLDQAGAGNAMRVRMMILPEAGELHHVRWECLRDPSGKPLFNGDAILFSRYLPTSHLRPLDLQNDLTALVAIANPPHLDQAINPEDPDKGLAPVDVVNEKSRAENGLRSAGFAVTTLASPPFGTKPATLDNILSEVEKGYDVLHLVCHGGLVPDGTSSKPMLWLEDGEDPVDAARLVEGIRNMAQPPRLVILASCQSAGTEGAAVSASGSLDALGPLLAEAGVPAVIAMQGNIKMSTVEAFLPRFFVELAKDGQIDRAMGKARAHAHDLDCVDYWMPALFMRLSDGMIWSDPNHQLKQQARDIFADQSAPAAYLPLSQVYSDNSQPGEVRPIPPGVWKTIASAPNLLPYAIFRTFESGRILAFGHEHLIAYQDNNGENFFLDAALQWLKGSRPATLVISSKLTDTLTMFGGPTFNLPVLQNKFSRLGFQTEALSNLDDKTKLSNTGVLVICNAWGDFTPTEIEAIINFVKDGGGLLAAGLGWSWQQYGPAGRPNRSPKPLAQYPMNLLFQAFGAVWTEYQTTA